MKGIIYGGDYYPEQWLDSPEILEKDIEFLKKAKMNVVSIGVFSWSVLEPKEGVFEFDWLEKIINKLYENGISSMLATPSGARPKWLSDKYPEVLRVNNDRSKNLFGARHNHCYTSPKYREKVNTINSKLAERFSKNPAVFIWHISNEYGGECHCDKCQGAFRKWLKEKYGTIENLNSKYWSLFWSHKYDDFDQIESPSTLGEMAVHALNLDWKRFVTYQTADFLKYEINSLKQSGA
ncbi:MAG: beta-galactosidase, partial [Bacilli bacterium]